MAVCGSCSCRCGPRGRYPGGWGPEKLLATMQWLQCHEVREWCAMEDEVVVKISKG